MDQIFKQLTKKSVEERLQKLIDQYKLGEILSVEKVKDWIFNDYGDSAIDATNRFQKKFFNCFKNIKEIDIDTNKFDEILRIATDAWNVFPHKSLNGKSPQEVVAEELEKKPNLRKRKSKKE